MTERRALKHHYRVYYMKVAPRLVFGRAELAALLARKVPRAIHHEVALIHTCEGCGTKAPWPAGKHSGPVLPTGDWLAYPKDREVPIWGSRYVPKHVYCSPACWNQATGGFELPRSTGLEPHRTLELDDAVTDARHAEHQRVSALRDNRKVPMPKWPGDGFCKWCTLAINEKGRQSWHAACVEDYFLHGGQLPVQQRFLRKRDGHDCAIEGCWRPGEQVDHRVPLWYVAHLPDDLRRWFYGPENLWLLCTVHHAEKTAAEAAVRAAIRRGDRDAPGDGPFDPLWLPGQ